MRTMNFPHCCTAKIVVDFGETMIAEGGWRDVSVDEIKSYINDQINSFYINSYAMLVASTNNQQTNANKALKELGFKHSAWMSKAIHPETKVRLWWKPLCEK